MNELAPIIFNEVKEAQKELSSLGAHVVNMSFPTEYPWSVFFSSSSWTVPDDGEYEIIVIGGGHTTFRSGYASQNARRGHGAGSASAAAPGGTDAGGGAGGISICFSRPLQKGQSVVVTVGASGGDSTAVCPAAALNMIANGATSITGGNASGGDINEKGGDGAVASTNSGAFACGGGGGLFNSNGQSGVIVRVAGTGTLASISSYAAIGGAGGAFGGAGGPAGVSIVQSLTGTNISIDCGSTATHGQAGEGGWLNRIPGYKSSGTNGEGLVAIRRVR